MSAEGSAGNGTYIINPFHQVLGTIGKRGRNVFKRQRSGKTGQKVSSGYDGTTEFMTSHQLGLPAQDEQNTKLIQDEEGILQLMAVEGFEDLCSCRMLMCILTILIGLRSLLAKADEEKELRG